jgi:hypothetical protein
VHRRPLAIGRYPVADELAAFGFRWFPADDPAAIAGFLADPDDDLLDHNEELAFTEFSLTKLPGRLDTVMRDAGWTSW